MPAKAKPKSDSSERERLVQELAKYLVEPPPSGQPLIFRSQLGLDASRQHVTVIWDRWGGIPLRDRSAILVEANESLAAGAKVDIVFAIGRTMEEAVELGYFPYRIAPALYRFNRDERERIEAALREEGAIDTREGLQLRFSTLDAAQDAFNRLQAKAPGPYWAIIEEVSRDG